MADARSAARMEGSWEPGSSSLRSEGSPSEAVALSGSSAATGCSGSAASTTEQRNDEWIEAITLALTWVPLSLYDEVQKRAERAMSEMLATIEALESPDE